MPRRISSRLSSWSLAPEVMNALNRSRPFVIGVLYLLPTALLLAQSEPIVRTQHQITIGGKALSYVAEAGRVDIASSETEEVHGRMFYVAYRVPTQGAPRPVTFMWNGGPGSASATLHFESVGPKRIENGKLVDNQETILGVTDLVFVDAIGTGFS